MGPTNRSYVINKYRTRTTTTDLNVVTSEASAANSLYSGDAATPSRSRRRRRGISINIHKPFEFQSLGTTPFPLFPDPHSQPLPGGHEGTTSVFNSRATAVSHPPGRGAPRRARPAAETGPQKKEQTPPQGRNNNHRPQCSDVGGQCREQPPLRGRNNAEPQPKAEARDKYKHT